LIKDSDICKHIFNNHRKKLVTFSTKSKISLVSDTYFDVRMLRNSNTKKA